ncbi:hydroxymethylglutaryl-CoA reductase, degradative [Vagococcus coleopterorum]|uniref:3-hydroxy-3-methylglutaryl coenzyme A reductase n=1 Tax=Vagococcus coleopterorum TaxID=2714946 RepID=A0A6G8ALB2_9ENTE|nr:hydroxymethylglutaryl-CoA reductase, degradative [Vagococcus coleopterorum]QIL45749.1 hydroxymethylglutaryl-CoA reductase, degradative [Vagococcus coleopterorum]
MTSNISQYYKKDRSERLDILVENNFLSTTSAAFFAGNTELKDDVANSLIENQVTQFPLPYGVALNFIVDGQDVIVPMVTEEPSVIAAASNGAKFMRKQGGFTTTVSERLLIGQIILTDVTDFEAATLFINEKEKEIFAAAEAAHPSIVKRGGGLKRIHIRQIPNEDGNIEFLTIHLLVDVKDAMGANIVNTILEGTSPLLESWLGATSLMSILSNFNDQSLVTSHCRVHPDDLATANLTGLEVAKKMVAATRYAHLDPYRAATHNKGIMNGIDAVLLATGNDWRAVEAGAHAYASRDGHYRSLTNWTLTNDGFLQGELTMPMPIGSVGGAISVLPLAKISQELTKTNSAEDLAKVIVSAGLAQNFSAVKALVSDGIQKGHMSLHAKSLAIHAGATGEEIDQVTALLKEQPTMSSKVAEALLATVRTK